MVFPAVFNLSSLNGTNGFVIDGINEYDNSGRSVSSAGDVNGDGIADIIINAPGANYLTGQSYVIFGSKEFTSPFNSASLNGQNGFAINGIKSDRFLTFTGRSVSSAGDVNADGIDDVIIGIIGSNNQPELSYIIFGSKNFSKLFNLTDLNGQNGFVLNDINSHWSAHSVSSAGDINDDGISDVIIGSSYVIFGSKNFTTPFNLTNLNGQNGFVINGGYSVSSAGDVNADGIADIIIGTPYVNNNAGQSYVLFGSKNFSTPFNFTNLNGQNGFIINGINPNDNSGWSVSAAGDVNADGIADIIIGAPYVNNNAGQSYVIFGSKNFSAPFNLINLNGQNGFIMNGNNSGGCSGWSVSAAGDVNADGIADIIIGAYYENSNYAYAGQSYVIFGSKNFTTAFNLTNLNGQNGFVINGINPNDNSGASVSTAGDVNADGIADIIIGAPWANHYIGQSYVVFGQASPFSSTPTSSYSMSSSASVSVAPSPSEIVSSSASSNSSSDSDKSGIIAGVIGGIAGALVIASFVFYKFLYKNQLIKNIIYTSADADVVNSHSPMIDNTDWHEINPFAKGVVGQDE